jgi:hypothetical protein
MMMKSRGRPRRRHQTQTQFIAKLLARRRAGKRLRPAAPTNSNLSAHACAVEEAPGTVPRAQI